MCLACAYLSVTGVVLVQLSVLSVGQSLCLFVHLFVSRSLSVSLCVALCLCPISIYALYPPPHGSVVCDWPFFARLVAAHHYLAIGLHQHALKLPATFFFLRLGRVSILLRFSTSLFSSVSRFDLIRCERWCTPSLYLSPLRCKICGHAIEEDAHSCLLCTCFV